ncbi:MAG: 2-hydroxyacyl-CoA dehydratase family protein [Thermodesulfobacteriota bacterium]|nr:2-hydroxyacyl-CoA dehydratase family protein [Thermodesulfobacteriota bacterium]
MRREFKEYNYDWMIWSIIDNASKAHDGTDKEYRSLLSFAPHFKDVLDAIIRQGEPGILLLKALSKYIKHMLTAHERGKKIALISYCFPPALLYAFDVVPLGLEVMTTLGSFIWKRGIWDYLDYCCEVGFTETSCTAQRGALGAYLAGLAVRPDFILCDTPGVCDTNANSFSFASAYLDIPFYQLNYPPTLTDERAIEYQREDFRHMIAFIEEQTGNKLDINRLREVIEETAKQDEVVCEIQDLQQLMPNPTPGIFALFIFGAKFALGGTKECTKLLEAMLERAKENAAKGVSGTSSGQERARVFCCYIEHFTTDLRFWTWMDKNSISHLGSGLDLFWQEGAPYAKGREPEGYSVDTTNLDTMIDSLAAQAARMPMVKQIRGPYDRPGMWLDDVIGASKIFKADFVAYFGTMGCRNTWGMIKLLARDTEKLGIPTVIMYSDSWDDRVASWGSITDRLDEFLTVRRIYK